MEQLKLNFEGGLLDRFAELDDVINAVVSDCGKLKKVVAAQLDIRPSDLSRMLGGELNFPTSKLEALMEYTGDYRPIYWQVERFLKKREEITDDEIAKAVLASLEAERRQRDQLISLLGERKLKAV